MENTWISFSTCQNMCFVREAKNNNFRFLFFPENFDTQQFWGKLKLVSRRFWQQNVCNGGDIFFYWKSSWISMEIFFTNSSQGNCRLIQFHRTRESIQVAAQHQPGHRRLQSCFSHKTAIIKKTKLKKFSSKSKTTLVCKARQLLHFFLLFYNRNPLR